MIFSGCAGAPTKIEQAIFKVETNREPVVTLEPVVTEVSETNAAGSVVTRFETNRIWVTNFVEAYQFTPNQTAQIGSAVVGCAAGLLGPYVEQVAMWYQLEGNAGVFRLGGAGMSQSELGDRVWVPWVHEVVKGFRRFDVG